MSSRDSIKVVCRIRPENAIEQGGGYKRCVEHNKFDINISVSTFKASNPFLFFQCEPTSQVSDMKGSHKFTFDRVFGTEAS